jgi:hypothetical protein
VSGGGNSHLPRLNNRADSNHRYTPSRAIRGQMVTKAYIAEGYGPDNVALCGLP